MIPFVQPMVFDVRRGLEIELSALPKDLDRALRRSFEYKNPAYEKLARMGRYTGNVERMIANYEVHDGRLILPRGATSKVRSALDAAGFTEDQDWWFDDQRFEGETVDFDLGVDADPVTPRDYQIGISDAIKKRENCLIRAGTGSGKTEAVIITMRELRQPTLVVVWSKGLIKEWMDRLKLRLGWRDSDIGLIEGRNRRIRPVTVAMQQTLYNGAQDLTDYFGFLVLDEVQRAAARTVREVVAMFPARYRVGVSADERRKDRLEVLTHDAFGDVAYEIPKETLIENGSVCEVEIVVVPTGFEYEPYESAPASQRALLYKQTIDAIVEDPERINLAAKLIAIMVARKHSVLAFSDRVDHCKDISTAVSLVFGTPCGLFLGGEKNREVYDETRERLDAGRLNAAVGTSCVYQGVNIPRLDVGVVTTPTATNRQLLEQQVGRLRRPFPGKKRGTLYYLWDERLFPHHIDLLRRWYGKKLVRIVEPSELGL